MKLGRERRIGDYYDQVKRIEIGNYFRERGDKYIAQVDIAKLVDFLYQKYALPLIEIDPEREAETERKSVVSEYRNKWGELAKGERNRVICTIFFIPHPNLELALALQASNNQLYVLEVKYDSRDS